MGDVDERRRRMNQRSFHMNVPLLRQTQCLQGIVSNIGHTETTDTTTTTTTNSTAALLTPFAHYPVLTRASNLVTHHRLSSSSFATASTLSLVRKQPFSTTTTTTTTTGTTKKNKKKRKRRKNISSSTPSWLKEEQTSMHESVGRVLKAMPKHLWGYTMTFLKWTFKCLRNPSHFRETMSGFWVHIKHDFQRYKLGTKMLVADVKVASNIISRVLNGYSLSRRERKQLQMTALDILRVGPLFMFIVVPGMEFVLPFAVKAFPNMLPTTFRETLKTQEDKKRLLRARIEMTSFFQSTMREFAEESKKKAKGRQEQLERIAEEKKQEYLATQVATEGEEGNEGQEGDEKRNSDKKRKRSHWIGEKDQKKITLELNRASKLMESIDKVREGAVVDTETIIEMAQLFKDGITLDTVSRSHLVAMCKYMGLITFGSDPYLRFQLRSAIRGIRNDDQSILWEGPESLSTDELKNACEERGMRASGLSRDEYLNQLQHWLDMSVNKNVPLTLLVMSRAFLFTTANPSVEDETAALQEAVSQLDEDVIVDAVIEAAESGAAMSGKPMDPEEAAKEMEVLSNLKLERMERQMELIEEEREEAKEIEKEKEEIEKEKQREAQENVEDPYKEQQPNVADVVLNASSGNAKTDVEDGLDERFDMKDHGEKAKDSEKIKAIKAKKDRKDQKRNKAKADAMKKTKRNAATASTTASANTVAKQGSSGADEPQDHQQQDHEELPFAAPSDTPFFLTHAEIEALESLATDSAVTFERSLFEKLKLLKREAEVADILSQTAAKQKMEQQEQEDALLKEEEEEFATMAQQKIQIMQSKQEEQEEQEQKQEQKREKTMYEKQEEQRLQEEQHKAQKEKEKEESLTKKLKDGATKIVKGDITVLEDLKESATKMADGMMNDTKEDSDEAEEEEDEEDGMAEVEEFEKETEKEADILRKGRSRLEKMIARLEDEINEVDEEIGSSLNLLDQNHDGMCTTQELRNAFVKVLKEDDMSKADALIELVDPNDKGYFKINELHELLETIEEDDVDMKIFEYLGSKSSSGSTDRTDGSL